VYDDVIGGHLVELASSGATWLFFFVVASLVVILCLSVIIVVAWRQIDGHQNCLISRVLSTVVERFFRRKPSAFRAQPAQTDGERSRLRRPDCFEAGPAALGSLRLTVPEMPDLAASSSTTSDGSSSGRLLLDSIKQQ